MIAWVILLPFLAAVLCFLLPLPWTRFVGLGFSGLSLLSVVWLSVQVQQNAVLDYAPGGWAAPLGIALRVDGLSALMLLLTAVIGMAVGLYAGVYFDRYSHQQQEKNFWPLWLLLWGGLGSLYVSADVFNIYVTLEIISLSAVALVTLSAERIALTAAMRYLLAATFGSLAYLLGVALLYAEHGVLSLELLQEAISSNILAMLALVLLSLGLLLKTAIFPFHFWLPLAHASAPAPVSALLSALVVKASYYVLLRLWLFTFAELPLHLAAQVLALIGTAALIYGSLQALGQRRLKLLIAYSTVAQLGYLALALALMSAPQGAGLAYAGGVFHVLSHALAKAALFLAAGVVLWVYGHDRLTGLRGLASRLPVSSFTLALASVSLVGLPPSGGFVAKWWLVQAAFASGQWYWGLVLLLGSLLSALYLFRLLGISLLRTKEVHTLRFNPRSLELLALSLALLAIWMGLQPTVLLELLNVPFGDGP